MRNLTPDADDVIKRAARRLTFRVAALDDFCLDARRKTQTIIRMCDVAGAEEFFARLDASCRRQSNVRRIT